MHEILVKCVKSKRTLLSTTLGCKIQNEKDDRTKKFKWRSTRMDSLLSNVTDTCKCKTQLNLQQRHLLLRRQRHLRRNPQCLPVNSGSLVLLEQQKVLPLFLCVSCVPPCLIFVSFCCLIHHACIFVQPL